jgi:signal transduction histidine kinase
VPLVAGDADRLARVWTELLSNAMDAMKDGGRITIMLRSLGDRVRASFADSGPGIGEAIRARVFDPFFTTKDPGSGMGLGLPIAKTIVESLSGSIGFESGPSGSVFHVELPAWNPAVESATEAGIGRSNGAAGEGD